MSWKKKETKPDVSLRLERICPVDQGEAYNKIANILEKLNVDYRWKQYCAY